ncbi:hypothetical protein HDU67_006725 [Dinochytrium kinnereticum]|nr:hypothetical protein HDU67_006725 [Dinochytrium kinnereticum]
MCPLACEVVKIGGRREGVAVVWRFGGEVGSKGGVSRDSLYTFGASKGGGKRRVSALDEDEEGGGDGGGEMSAVSASIRDKKLRTLLTNLRNIQHPTISPLLLACAPSIPDTPPTISLVHSLSAKGTLVDLFATIRFPLNPIIKMSMCRDVAAAISYLQYSDVGPHGLLSPCGMILNYIFSNGEMPFADRFKHPADAVSSLMDDSNEGRVRPRVAEDVSEDIRKLITQSWSPRSSSRPNADDLLSRITKSDPRLSTYPLDSPETSTRLLDLHSKDLTSFTIQTTQSLTHLSIQTRDSLSQKCHEAETARHKAENRVAELLGTLTTEKEVAVRSLGRVKEELRRGLEESGREVLVLRRRVLRLQREVIAARNGLLPRPLAEVVVTQTLTTMGEGGEEVNEERVVPNVDMIFQPTVYDSATMLVASISGFNRYIQQLSTAPRLLLDLLKAYYDAIDAAIEASAVARPAIIYPNFIQEGDETRLPRQVFDELDAEGVRTGGGVGRVHVVERICDACILVGGAPDRTDNHAEDVVDVGMRLLEWASKWDASHILGGTDARVSVRVGIHSGPVTAGVIGAMPKFLLMGGE